MDKGSHANLAISGATLKVRVTPGASRMGLSFDDGTFKIQVTTVPADGKATKAVVKVLARALGVAPSRLSLVRGAASRDKVFRLD